MKLEGQVVIVTGAGSGIGRAMAKALAHEGANVIGVDLFPEPLEEVAAELKDEPGSFVSFAGNCMENETNDGMIAFAVEKFGKLDTLIFNCGIMDDMAAVGDYNEGLVRKVFELNTFGAMRAMQAAVNQFLAQMGPEPEKGKINGRIIITGSVGSHHHMAGVGYCASKAAVVEAARHTAFMYLDKGIKVNVINPGAVMTNISKSMPSVSPFGASRANVLNKMIPCLGAPEQLASVAVFLSSDDSSYINGQEINVDGGWTNL